MPLTQTALQTHEKTLITSTLIAALAAPAVMAQDTTEDQGDYVVKTHEGTYAQDRGNYYGFTLSLTDTVGTTKGFLDTTTTNPDAPDLSTLSEVVLNSVAIEQRDTAGSGHKAYLAVYEYAGDGTTGKFIAVSSNTNDDRATGGYNTFNFADVTIDPKKQYQFLFVKVNTTGGTDSSKDISTFEGYKANATQFGFSVSKIGSIPSGDGVYTALTLDAWAHTSSWESYMPNVSISVTATPEPATATLSLLALAGLCARRRRK